MELLKDKATLDAYSIDAGLITIKPLAVVIPSTYDEIKETIEYAKQNEQQIIIRGSGTNLVANAVGNGIVLDVSKLNKVLNLDVNRKLITLQSGVILYNLNNFLREYGLMFPIIPSSQRECTIGGMISCNAAGRAAVKYGKTLDWLSRVRVMMPDGEIVEYDGERVKNFASSEGSFGVIVEVVLKLALIPKKRSVDVMIFNTTEDLIEQLKFVEEKKPISIEFINKRCAMLLGKGNAHVLFIEYDHDKGQYKDDDKIAKIWALRDDAYPVLAQKGYSVIEDPEAMNWPTLQQLLEFFELKQIPCFGHIGIGVIHPCFKQNQEDIVKEMYDFVLKSTCNITGEHGFGHKKKQYMCESNKAKFKRLKTRYDPNNVFYSAILSD